MGAVLSSIGIPIQPMLALMTGSIPLTGGHGNSAAVGPVAVQMGFPSALSISVAAATFGLVSGCLLGGPVANGLIVKKGLMTKASKDVAVSEADLKVKEGSVKELGQSFFLIIVALGVGSILFEVFKVLIPTVTLPIHVMGMLAGVLFRIGMDVKKVEVPEDTIDKLSNVFLGIFVSMAVYTMKLWELVDLALPIIIILLIQLVVIWAFVRFLTFPLMGGDYDAAVICAGHIGFGLGAVPVSMANMNSVCSKFRYSKLAYFVVPIIGALFSNFTNAAIITLWMNWCK
jgi:ESS family glutamate:Na+ symporter